MCDTEVYTVRVDTVYASSNVDFVVYLNNTLKNVVKAELIYASVHANTATSNIMYVYVTELMSKFNDRASSQYKFQASGTTSTEGSVSAALSNVTQLTSAFATIPTDQQYTRTIFKSGSDFPIETKYIEPIRQLDRLSIKLMNATGGLLPERDYTYMLFRFTCATKNVCRYP